MRWDEKLEPPTIVKFQGLHRFWQPNENETRETTEDDAKALRVRKIEFTGHFSPVKWQCRAPLSSGKLCPRRDRHKCPFHGVVVARDEMGNPTLPEDRLKIENDAAEKDKPPDWQDPELLRDLEAATGLDLTVGKKKKKKAKKKPYPNLTDVTGVTKTSRQRLESKVFHKSAVKRVSAALDNLDYKKHRDKFGDQYNYVHETV